ncbi:hypothetical protein [Serinicoccus sp. CUA-874]|uniref:hypothetical protein n=1 Tax=Serinicoccus sp. CUA-874 TaxID=1517939 RepID=UPI00117AEEFC|nr:hypothetical protein [Serinicoccus sp. CUA-874]
MSPMRWYADAPARRSRQVTADLLVLAWVVLWVLVGRWVFALVMTLAAPADPLRSAGTGMQSRMTDVAGRVVEIPLVGDSLQAPFSGAAGVGTDLVTAGDRLEGGVTTLAWLVTLLSAGTPILLTVLIWAALRLAWARRARSLGRELGEPQAQELLALRALVHQRPRRLQEVLDDPVTAWRARDPEAIRVLADLELADVGLRTSR